MSRSPGRERWAFLGLAYTLLAISATAAALAHAPADVAPWPAVRWLAGPLVTWLSETAAPGAPVSPSTVSPPPGWPVPDRLVPDQSVPGWLPTGWSMPAWPIVALVAAVWVAPVAWLHPRRDRRRVLVLAHYLVLVLLAGALIVASPAFILFAAIGYPLAIAMLPARLVMAGVTLTAVVNVAAQAGRGGGATLPTVLAGVALPLVIAGWYVAGEHDKRRRLVGRLRAAMAENADLNARLLGQARRAGMLDERHRVAGEIHDTVAQDLVALIGQLDAAERVRDDPARRRHLDQAAELARRSLSEARRSVRALHPEQLEDARLPEAVTRMAESWSKSSGVDLTLEITGTPVALAADVEAALFRVAQEALANVAKHARATRTGLTLSYTDETILLDIRDNGTGFTPQEPGDGFGLDGMRQRVRGVGGTLDIESEPGGGTAVAAAVPSIPAEGT
ncbi:sensor histidine kinase [Nonomuraea phyllanthi]|uniref:Oxygen sensor histidine kinase NreB n=1 Tax=Nonomuraea phyllanthi TaxID=2219224 RepID=A0A5C4WFL9_9ACTN|nr:sensor histidine kinase [Nonomuraea phyllanthi]KAB8193635.1 sensor histidine kinase [Nonomuraea phyllanthi]